MFLTPQRNSIPWAWGDFLRDGHLKCPSADLQVPSIAFIPKLQEFAPKTGSQVDHLRSDSAFTFACFFGSLQPCAFGSASKSGSNGCVPEDDKTSEGDEER